MNVILGASSVVCLVFIVFVTETKCLKDVIVSAPLAVKTFDTVTLQCKYNLEGEQLYSVKWYKGTQEFFRYIPREWPSFKVFHLPGINIDLSKSSEQEVVLVDVRPETTGRFKCEVSTDAPNFYTMIASLYIYVVDVSHDDALMNIEKVLDDHGQTLKANCTSPPSWPSMNITWYINGIMIPETHRAKINISDGSKPFLRRTPVMTISYLEKELDNNVYQNGVLRVQCVTTLFNLYKSENVRYVDDDRPQPWLSSVIGVVENCSDKFMKPMWSLTSITIFVTIYR